MKIEINEVTKIIEDDPEFPGPMPLKLQFWAMFLPKRLELVTFGDFWCRLCL